MPSEAPIIAGGGIVCALGAHVPSVMGAMTAGVDGLASLPGPNSEGSVRVGIVRGLIRKTRTADLVTSMLADAVDYSLSGMGEPVRGPYAAVFAVPNSTACGPSDAPASAELMARGLNASFAAFLGTRLHPPAKTQVFVGDAVGGPSMEAAVSLLREQPNLDACLVAASDPCAYARALSVDAPHHDAIGDAAGALWLVRSQRAASGPRLLSVASGQSIHANVAVRLAILGALERAHTTLAEVKHLVHNTPWGSNRRQRYEAALRFTDDGSWHGERWSPACSIGHVGVASGVIQTLQAAYLTQREGGGDSALVLLSDLADYPTAWVVSAPAVGQPRTHPEGRVPCAW